MIPAGACVPEKSLVFGLEPRQPHAHDVHSRCEAPKAVDQCLRPPPKLQRLGQRSHAELRHLIPPPVIFDKALQLTTRLVVLRWKSQGARALHRHHVLGSPHPLQRLLLGEANEIRLRRLQLGVDAALVGLEAGVAIDELDAGVLGEALRRKLLGRDQMTRPDRSRDTGTSRNDSRLRCGTPDRLR